MAVLAPLTAAAPRAHADDDKAPAELSGTYAIEGTFNSGKPYTGTLELSKKKTLELRKGPKFVSYAVKIKYSTDWEGIGVGTLIDGRFYFAMAKQGKYFTVSVFRPTVLGSDIASTKRDLDNQNAALEAAWHQGKRKNDSYYHVKGDPWWTDVWNHANYGMFFKYNGDWGTEGLGATYLDEHLPLGEGKWSWQTHFYNDDGKDVSAPTGNTGDMVSEKLESGAYKITRRLWLNKRKGVDIYDDPLEGIGLMPDASTLVVVYAGDGSEGVGYLDINGKTLEGKLCDTDDPTPYVMKATVPENVVSKNPGLFH